MRSYYQQSTTPSDKSANPLPAKPASNAALSAHVAPVVKFKLREVVFSHSELLTTRELKAAVRPFIGKEIGQAGIAKLLDAVNALYVKRDIATARAVLQHGVIKNGVLHVKLVEGRLGRLEIKGLHHLHSSFVRRRIHLEPGDVVKVQSLRDNLVYINRTTNLQLSAVLEPGQAYGQTNVVVHATEPSRHNIDVFVDNNGVQSTGRLREGVNAHLYGLFGAADTLALDLVHSKGSLDGLVAWSMPVTVTDGSLSVQVSRSRVNVIAGAFRDINITGRSTTASLGYTQPFVATMHWLFSGIGQIAMEDAKTRIVGQSIANTKTRQVILGATLRHFGNDEEWGVTQLVSRLRSDEPMLGKRSFVVAPGSAFYLRRLGSRSWAVRMNLGWQLSSGKNIPSANLFQIGGPGSVRGYDRGVLSGPRGYYADVELHRMLGRHLDVFAFVDHGTIFSFYPSNAGITGSGLGVFYNRGDWLTISAEVAKSMDAVIPDQSSVLVNARVVLHWH